MAIDLFEPRTMGRMLQERKGPKMFVRDKFFSNAVPYDTEHVDFDIETKVRTMAPFSSPKLAGQVVDDTGFVTKSFTPPTVQPKKVTTAENLQKRVAGEALYGGMSPDERAAVRLAKDLGDLDDMISRREEWMCVQAALNGSILVVGPGVNVTLDFGRNAGNTIPLLAAADRWTAGTAKIEENLDDWRRIISQQCGLAPDVALLGRSAAKALKSNTALVTQLNTLRIDLGRIAPEYDQPRGVTYIGRLAGMDLWEYNEWYIDPENIGAGEQPMIPDKVVMLGSSQAQTELAYGAVPKADEETKALSLITGTRVPDSWIQKEPAARFVKVSARPLPIPTQVNAFLKATVVA